MVQNPIYESDGPVYDSVQPEFNHKDMHAANTCIDIKHQGLELSTSPLKRYVDQPSIMHSGSFSFSLSSKLVKINDSNNNYPLHKHLHDNRTRGGTMSQCREPCRKAKLFLLKWWME